MSKTDINDGMTKTQLDDIDKRMVSASDTTTELKSEYAEFEHEDAQYLNDTKHSQKDVTPLMTEMVSQE